MAAARASSSRPSALWLARVLTEIALLVVIALGLSGAVLGRVLPALGHPVYVIGGPSMEPTIHLGSAVILDRIPAADLAVDDVVTLRPGTSRAVFTHRIARLVARPDGPWLETKGDNNAHADPAIVPASTVIGRVSLVVPAAGYLMMLLSIPAGVVLILSLGATIMVLGWYLDGLDHPAPRPAERTERAERAERRRPRPPSTPPLAADGARRPALGAASASARGVWPIGLAVALPAAAASRPILQLHAFALPAMPWPRAGMAPAPVAAPVESPLASPIGAPAKRSVGARASRLAVAMPASAAGRPLLQLVSLGPTAALPAAEPAPVLETVGPPEARAGAPIEAVPSKPSPKRSSKSRSPRARGATDGLTASVADPPRRTRRTARAAS